MTLAAAVSAVAACSSSSSNNSGVSIQQACSDVAQARCNQRSECSLPQGTTGTGFNVLENYGDMTTCLAREALACQNGLSAPQTGNSPATVEKCVVAFSSYTCADFFDNQPPSACTPTGPLATGATCTFNGQCASGFCNGRKDSACGTCGPPPKIGDDCSTSTCVRGARCVASDSICAAVVIQDGICDETHPCERGLSCLRASASATTGTCEPASAQVGVSCGGTIPGTDGGLMPGCDSTRGLYCGGPRGAKTCMPVGYAGTTTAADGGITAADGGAAGPTPAGTTCGQLPDGTRVGCAAGTCMTSTGVATGSDMGTCQPFAGDGQPCDTMLGPGCMSPARCVTTSGTAGTCVVPTASMCPAM
jgi:hypothetical protein